MFLQSRHLYELEVKGILIPKKDYSEQESQYGKRNIIELSEGQLDILKSDKVFAGLLKNGQYVIMDKLPSLYMTAVEKLKISEENYIRIINEKDKLITELNLEISRLKKVQTIPEPPVENETIEIPEPKLEDETAKVAPQPTIKKGIKK